MSLKEETQGMERTKCREKGGEMFTRTHHLTIHYITHVYILPHQK